MSGQYSNDNDSRTLTAGAAAVTLTGVIDGPRNIDAYTKGIPVWAEFRREQAREGAENRETADDDWGH